MPHITPDVFGIHNHAEDEQPQYHASDYFADFAKVDLHDVAIGEVAAQRAVRESGEANARRRFATPTCEIAKPFLQPVSKR